jgi:hypothetical protein
LSIVRIAIAVREACGLSSPLFLKKPKNERRAGKELFSFMAAFGRHRDQCARKQGDPPTFL